MKTERSDSKPNNENAMPTHPSLTTTSAKYAHEVYLKVLEESEIDDYLNNSDVFNSRTRQWLFSAGSATKQALVKSVFSIVSSIVGKFVKPTQPGVGRRAVNVYGLRGNTELDEDGHSLYSDLVIRASGPSFEDSIPAKNSGTASGSRIISFSNTASCVAIRLDSEMGTTQSIVKEMEKCARRIFASQPNQLYVRCMVVTNKYVRMIHFDRAGAQTTPLIDIHQHPATFIRLVAGLASTDERLLGFDDSIQWTITDGRKAQGTLTTTASDGTVKTYPIIGQIPFPCETYIGRGTVCWRVRDPDTSEELVVKDSWRPHDRPSEHEFLRLWNDIPGVVHMVSYETCRGETKDYRCITTLGRYVNRVSERIVMKSYGKSVKFFTSPLQLLCAIRDAIAGHQHLVDDNLRILHRDISHNNILLGEDGAKKGYRGFLVDFDTAFRATDEQPTIIADHNVGTRIFQSLCVLSSYAPQHEVPAHDHVDELESFFYVVAFLFLIHRPDGTRVSGKEEGPAIVAKWDDVDPSASRWHKRGIFGGSRDGMVALKLIEKTWGPTCTAFYKKFRYWMSDMREDKAILASGGQLDDDDEDEDGDRDKSAAKETVTLESFLSRRNEHYSQVLSFFDEAIEALQASHTCDALHTKPEPISQDGEAPQLSTPDDATVIALPVDCTPLPEAQTVEASTLPVDDATVDATPSGETTSSTPSSSLEPPAPTTPPPTAPSAFAVYSNPSSPRLKRRSEDAVHPDSPPSKGRRVEGVLLVPSQSP